MRAYVSLGEPAMQMPAACENPLRLKGGRRPAVWGRRSLHRDELWARPPAGTERHCLCAPSDRRSSGRPGEDGRRCLDQTYSSL